MKSDFKMGAFHKELATWLGMSTILILISCLKWSKSKNITVQNSESSEVPAQTVIKVG